MKQEQKEQIRRGLKITHSRINTLVNNYYKQYILLPNFSQIDEMWLTTIDKISDPAIRGRLRQVSCAGILRNDNQLFIALGIPKALQDAFEDV